jgi:hypothetical protein
MRRWLGRLSYSLLIIGGVLFYQVYKWQTSTDQRIPGWEATIIVIGGCACIALGAQGIRFRHEQMRQDFDRDNHGN